MKLVLDMHVHTLASGHAYSTLHEYVMFAKKNGIELFAQTDHGPAMPGAGHEYHIGNQIVLPRVMEGIEVLRGVEANILDISGKIDVGKGYLKRLDFVIASLHTPCIKSGTVEENTEAIINAMKNPYVDAIAHSGNPKFPINIERFVKAAKEEHVLIEINNSSFTSVSRRGSAENCIKIAKIANEIGAHIMAGSDSHICYDLGKFDKVIEVFDKINMNEELVVNTSVDKLKEYLRENGKEI